MKNKKGIKVIIVIILILLVIAIGFGIYIFNKNNGFENDWEESYYGTLLYDSKEETITYNIGNIEESNTKTVDYYNNAKNVKVKFIQLKEDTLPVMVVNYEKAEKNRLAIYQKNTNGIMNYKYPELDFKTGQEFESALGDNFYIQFLYNIEENKYMWYKKRIDENNTTHYDPLDMRDENGNLILEGKNYHFTEEEMKTNQVSEDGTPILSKFEETFIIVDNIDENWVNIDNIHNISEKDLKKSIKTVAKNYKDNKEIITEEVKKTTETKLAEKKQKKEQIKVAEEQKAQKEAEEKAKAEEEARIKAEEEIKKGLKVGKYTLKYGTYKLSTSYEGYNGTIILEPNGKCHFKGNIDPDYQSKKNVDADAIYKVRNDIQIDVPGVYDDGLEFNVNGKTIVFIVTDNSSFSDQWHGYKYSGN